ncbi:MAG: amidohydrolase, partial [Candidatus Acidiferrales bacterium]
MSKRKLLWAVLSLAGVVVLTAFWLEARAQTRSGFAPDAIYHNGKIVTVDQNFSIAQAFAVYDDKFVAVGSNSAMLALAGPRTRKIDLQGRTVVPGLMDDHYHYLSNAANDFKEISLVYAKSYDEFLQIIKTRADQTPPGEPIATQSGWLPDQFGGKLPNKADLDKVSPRNPLFIRGGHTMYLNSSALKLAGITRDTPNPPGGVISKDEKTGDLTGELIDSASAFTGKFMPRSTDEEKLENLRRAQKLLNSVGLTGVRDPGVGPSDIRIYQKLWESNEMTVRVSTNLSLPSNPPAREILAMLSPWGVSTRFGDNKLRLDGIGEFGMDGGFQAALLREP